MKGSGWQAPKATSNATTLSTSSGYSLQKRYAVKAPQSCTTSVTGLAPAAALVVVVVATSSITARSMSQMESKEWPHRRVSFPPPRAVVRCS